MQTQGEQEGSIPGPSCCVVTALNTKPLCCHQDNYPQIKIIITIGGHRSGAHTVDNRFSAFLTQEGRFIFALFKPLIPSLHQLHQLPKPIILWFVFLNIYFPEDLNILTFL